MCQSVYDVFLATVTHTCMNVSLTCSRVTGNSGQVQLSFIGRQFAQQRINGSFLPLVVQFKTQLPNGLLFYAHSNSTEVSIYCLKETLVLYHIEYILVYILVGVEFLVCLS